MMSTQTTSRMIKRSLSTFCIFTVTSVSFAMASPWATASANTPSDLPNIVYFLIDDMGWKDLGCFGAELYETPNMDRLCAEGMRFSHAYTSAPICSPARATTLTGVHPMKMQMWNHHHGVPQGKKILPQYLKEAGYQTWHVGKWHMGNAEENTLPEDLGFDVNIAGSEAWGPGSYFWPYLHEGEDGRRWAHPRNSVPMLIDYGKEGEQLTDRLTEHAVDLLEQREPGQPFYLNFWYYSVHDPKEAKPELIEKYERKIEEMGIVPTTRFDPKTGSHLVTSETNATYAAMIESVDQSVGRVVDKLKEIGEYENTLFVFYSDNGPTTNDVPATPLHGGKNSTYEAGVRVPAFFTWKGHIEPGSYYPHPIYIGDVFNTVLEAVGKTPPSNDSLSLMPVFNGERLTPREFIWYFPDRRLQWAQRANAAIYDETSGMKYILFFNGDRDELYNIKEDIGETRNLIEQEPEVAARLKARLVKFLRDHIDDMPPPRERYIDGVKERLSDG